MRLSTVFTLVFLLVAPAPAMAEPAAISGRANPCVEGDFLDIGEKQCKTLDKTFGFDWATFEAAHDEANIHTITSGNCTELSFDAAIESIRLQPNGGTINIEACDLILSNTYQLPNNILIQGMGADLTSIRAANGFTPTNVFWCDRGDPCDNVVLRDFKAVTLNPQGGKPVNYMSIRGADNVLFERIWSQSIAQQFLIHAQSVNVTARYLNIQDSGSQSLGAKDCFPTSGQLAGPLGSWGTVN